MGTYSWVYLGQVACDEGLSIGSFVVWTGALVLTMFTNTMFTKLGSAETFGIFSVTTVCTCIFFYFMLRETKGLSRDEAMRLYAKADKEEAE